MRDNLYYSVAAAMGKRGYLNAAATLHQRWDEYPPAHKSYIAKMWGIK